MAAAAKWAGMMTTTPLRPVLRFTCSGCGSEMIRVVADGLLIGDGFAVVQGGYVQACGSCGREHKPGEVIWFRRNEMEIR